MKKLGFLLCFVCLMVNAAAQTAVNADGTLKFRGNVAILVEGSSFTFQDGKFVKQVDDDVVEGLKTVLRTFSMQKFQNICFGVVNRDNEALGQVAQLIKENKLEDYLDGVSVSAKNQGADYLFLVDVTNYAENDVAAQIEISTRLINVENNMGYHAFYRSDAMALNDEDDMREKARQIINDFSASLEDFLLNIFPEQYFIAKADGKTWNLGAYQPNGRILPSDKFHAFRLKKESMQLGETAIPVQILQHVAVCEKATANGGYIQVKSDESLGNNTSDIVLFRNIAQPIFQGLNQMTMTFFGLDYRLDSYDGLVKKRINNAVFSAITRHPGLQLIEHDLLPQLKKERELQKSEDFIEGHVVEQMKAIGAAYLLTLESYGRTESQVTFKMALISVAENRIVRTIDVTTSIDNIENEMYKQICDRIANPCNIKKINNKTLEMTSPITLREGDRCIVSGRKVVKSPLTGEVTYSKTKLCKLTVEQYAGNRCVLSVDEIFDKEGMEEVENNSRSGLITFIVDGSSIKSDVATHSDVKQKAVKKEKRKGIWRNLKEVGRETLKGTLGNMKINVK